MITLINYTSSMASVICDILRSLEVKQPKCKKVIYHR